MYIHEPQLLTLITATKTTAKWTV